MAVKIRLRAQGRKNRIVYRLVVTDSRNPCDGKYLETLGWYNPYAEEADKNVFVDAERVSHWLNQGAELSDKAEKLVKRAAPEIMVKQTQKKLEIRRKACVKKRASRKKRETAIAA